MLFVFLCRKDIYIYLVGQKHKESPLDVASFFNRYRYGTFSTQIQTAYQRTVPVPYVLAKIEAYSTLPFLVM